MTKDLKLKSLLMLGITLFFIIYLMPSFLGKEGSENERSLLPSWWPGEPINLGLDLKGGMHMVYNIRSEVAIENEINHLQEGVKERFKAANIAIKEIVPDGKVGIQVNLDQSADVSSAHKILEEAYGQNNYQIRTLGKEGVAIELSTQYQDYLHKLAIEQVRKNITKRIDELGVKEPTVITKGARQIVVELPGVLDPKRAENILKKPGVLHLKLVKDFASTQEELLQHHNGKLPDGHQIYLEKDKLDSSVVVGAYLLRAVADIDGTRLKDARMGYDDNGQYAVNFALDPQGAKDFGELTSKNIGQRLAIVLENEVKSAPSIRSRIDSNGQITGNFTLEEAQDLAIVLRSGALPVPIDTEEQRTVGASLGADSIRRGEISVAIGAILVVGFMLFYYHIGGIIANIALLLNVIFILGSMVMIGATLTLPGIAGIVLTIGMAVDANVIIFERIREELRIGKTLRSAIESGYSKALSAIIDSNLTTMISALVLGQYGTGPIKGFAVTLAIGLVSSVFTAVVVTRWIFESLFLSRKLAKITMLSIVPPGINLNFTGKKHIGTFAAISVILILGAISLFPTIKYGIDFEGGTEIIVKFNQEVHAQDIRNTLEKLPIGESVVQNFGEAGTNEFAIKVGQTKDQAKDQAVEELSQIIADGFTKDFGDKSFEILKKDHVGPKAGAELRRNGFLAVLFSSIMIVIYLAFRFDYKYSPGAIVAAIHDAIIPVGVMLLLDKEFTLQTVAALLAIVGYSINDTIIVFDRIRENRERYRNLGLRDILRKSVNETLSRTILTSFTTILSILPMMFFGGAIIEDFALSLFVGIVVGTYSSIFVASPLLLYMEKRFGNKSILTGKIKK